MSNSEHEISVPQNPILYSSVPIRNSADTHVYCDARNCLWLSKYEHVTVEGVTTYLCSFHYAFMQLCIRTDTADVREEAS